jgi:hypothetical protein
MISKVIMKRSNRLKTLVAKYKRIREDLISLGVEIAPLPSDNPREILSDDSFWDLERFHVNEPWALNPNIRKGCDMILQLDRAEEEIRLLQTAMKRFLFFHYQRLNLIKSVIEDGCIDKGSVLYEMLQLETENSNSSVLGLKKHFDSLWTRGQTRKSYTSQQQQEWIHLYEETIKVAMEGLILY